MYIVRANYKQTYIKIRKFLLELNQPIIDLSKMNKYIQTNEKGQTVEASLRSFTPINGRAPKIIYDHAATATGIGAATAKEQHIPGDQEN